MTERKFNIPLIALAAVSFALSFFGLPVGSILLALGVIVISLKMREKYLTKIQILISVIAIAASLLFLGVLIWQEVKGIGASSYWLMRLIFGEMK
ncbi:hypothetical protein [Ruminococcus flavefaciens]|uniref:DUF4190 domain-containing protein n=1 Tax=Ruminococcus flavefaciens 007c TaxID=1341157 RepID=W7UGM8_RUMFL|nr:hypothetical protein [Ruminococcus flavefaciens]EWM54346.1 hypothetical protein RF007C_12105 [Ruminococcus flavefaciens 007c]